MLFNRMIPPSCSYCRYGTLIGVGEVACLKRGITSVCGSCRNYFYDPLKREPERPERLNAGGHSEAFKSEDFEL